MAVLADAIGESRSTARLLGAAAVANLDMTFPAPEQYTHSCVEASARHLLGSDNYATEWHSGRRLRHEAVDTEIDRVLTTAEEKCARQRSDRGESHLLTPREQAVLRLLIDGRSNPEIAIALFISTHTVARHVTNILGKFDVETRAAAVAYAYQHDLV